MATIGPGFYDSAARRSGRNAIIRNGLFAAILLASMALWLTQGRDVERIIVLTVEGLFVALFIWRAWVGFTRMKSPVLHPLFTDFAPYGDPLTLAAEVEAAVSQGRSRAIGTFLVTDRFLVRAGLAHSVVAFSDVAWVYPKVTKHSVSFIPTGTTRSLELFTFSSNYRALSLTLDGDDALLEALRASSPKARFGFTPENERWWRDERRALRHPGASYPSRSP